MKDCYCHTCDKDFHPMGIASHRAGHRRRKEDCKITFTNGDTFSYSYAVEMKAGALAIDAWKLPIFERHLNKAKYPFIQGPGETEDILYLKVAYEEGHRDEMLVVMRAASEECAEMKAAV